MTDRPYAQVFAAVDDDRRLNPYAFRLYVRYLRRAGWENECWESDTSISKATRMKRETIIAARRLLEACGYIKLRRSKRGTAAPYVVTCPRLDEGFFRQLEMATGPVEVKRHAVAKTDSDAVAEMDSAKRHAVRKGDNVKRHAVAKTDSDAVPRADSTKKNPQKKNDFDVRAAETWDRIKQELQLRITRQNYDSWVRPTQGIALVDGNLLVEAPNDMTSDWLSTRMHSVISQAVIAVMGPGAGVAYRLAEERAAG